MYLYSKRRMKRLRSYSVACLAAGSLIGTTVQAQPVQDPAVQQPIVQQPIVQQPIVQEPAFNEPAPAPAPEALPVAEPAATGPHRDNQGTPAGDTTPAPPSPTPPLIPDGASPPGPVAPAFPPAIPNIDFGARMRIGVRLQDQVEDPESFGDIAEQADLDMYMGGQIHRMFKWQAGVTVSYSGNQAQPSTAAVLPLDLLARFEPMPEFNIYLGRMIVVADRYVPSGPWGMDEFYFPGVFQGAPAAVQKSGSTGRDVGANIWGAFGGGHFKYYLGAYQLHDPALNPLLSGRLQVSLLSPEPAFYQRTTYYGDKDLVSIGVGGQYQADGSVQVVAPPAMGMPAVVPMVDDHSFFTADLTLDKKFGDAGTLSFTGGAHLFGGDFRTYDSLIHAAVGFTFPQVIGIGKLRPNVRFQQAQSHVEDSDASTFIDVQLSYLVMNWFTRVSIGYRRSSIAGAPGTDNTDANMITLGLILADP
jgi:hypothetical protein